MIKNTCTTSGLASYQADVHVHLSIAAIKTQVFLDLRMYLVTQLSLQSTWLARTKLSGRAYVRILMGQDPLHKDVHLGEGLPGDGLLGAQDGEDSVGVLTDQCVHQLAHLR